MAQQLSTNTFGCAKWIVSSDATQGTHTTIAGALTSASSGDTIFIRPGTYTENLTLKAGINLSAFGSDSSLDGSGKVIINGTCTFTAAGSVTIYGIQLQTNSVALLAVTGSAASIVNLSGCYLNCTNTTGITFSTSSASAVINIFDCFGDIGTTGITLFAHSSAGRLRFENNYFTNTGNSTTASTASAGTLEIFSSNFQTPITTSGTNSIINMQFSNISSNVNNATSMTIGGSGTNSINNSNFNSGTASALSIGATLTISLSSISSSNTNAITGGGTINYSGLTFPSSSATINTTTQTTVGTLKGSTTTTPSAGFLGEQIRGTKAVGSAINLSTGTAADVTTISLTAGIWDVSGIIGFGGGAITGTQCNASISAVSATIGANSGDDQVFSPTVPTVSSNTSLTIPSLRVTLTTTTTYYLVARGTFSVGTMTAWGRISATRVG